MPHLHQKITRKPLKQNKSRACQWLCGILEFERPICTYDKHIAKKSVKQIAKPPKGRASRDSLSTVVTPACSQELTQTPNHTGICSWADKNYKNSPHPRPEFNFKWWNRWRDYHVSTRQWSIRQRYLSTTNSKKWLSERIWEAYRQKETPKPYVTWKIGDAYNNVDSISELTRFLWKRVEEHERVNDMFQHKRDMHAWVRRNLKTSCSNNLLLQEWKHRAKTSVVYICMLSREN